MGWQFWRQKPLKQEANTQFDMMRRGLERRLVAMETMLEESTGAQARMLDERTRIMAEAVSVELRALGRILADLSLKIETLNGAMNTAMAEARSKPAPPIEQQDSFAVPVAAKANPPTPLTPPVTPPPLPTAASDDLHPPPAANDRPRADLDPMLLDALTKGRVAFDVTKVTSIPPRATTLSVLYFAPPLPAFDMATLDRLAELFPDAAVLLDRFIMDAAASMLKMGQVPVDLPLLVPLSPVTARDPAAAADFQARFKRSGRDTKIIPLFSEQGWIALVEEGADAMARLVGERGEFAIRASGHHRIDPAAIGALGVRYVLAPAQVLAAVGEHKLVPDIHSGDVARLFSRVGIALIAENVTDQVSVLGLLRNNIVMGWGPALPTEETTVATAEGSRDKGEPTGFRSYLRRATS